MYIGILQDKTKSGEETFIIIFGNIASTSCYHSSKGSFDIDRVISQTWCIRKAEIPVWSIGNWHPIVRGCGYG